MTVVKNHKKLLFPLNSPPSVCLEYKVSSKLKHLPSMVHNFCLKTDRCQHSQVSVLTGNKNYKNICHHYIQGLWFMQFQISSKLKLLQLLFKTMAWKMTGTNIGSYQIWQASRIAKKLLLLLNSPPSISVKYEMSSKLKHLLFLVQNYGLKIDRRQKLQKDFVTTEFRALD